MNTHDIDIELPPLPEALLKSYIVCANGQEMRIRSYDKDDMQAYARSAIEADRKRRGEPIAWVKPDIVENQFINMRPRRVWWECNEGIGMPIFTAPQPAEPEPCFCDRMYPDSNPEASCGDCPIRDYKNTAESVKGLSAGQLAEILAAYIKPEIIGEALEKLENAPWELSEPVKHDLYKTGDKDAPEQIRDRNGVVVLDCCKRCGKFESQLSEPCVAEPAKVPSAEVERLIDIYGFRCEHYGREAAESARQILLASYGQCS